MEEDRGFSGSGSCSGSGLGNVDLGSGGSLVVVDDDIEDFSSPEDNNNAKGKNDTTIFLFNVSVY